MRVTVAELMDRLGVGYMMGPYESRPWSFYDSAKGVTVSAEVRMSSDSNEVEAEIQLMYDTPPAGKPSMEQTFSVFITPGMDGLWTVTRQAVRGVPYKQDLYDWEGKSCAFFKAVAECLQREEMPDIDKLLEQEYHNRDGGTATRGGASGSQKPKVSPGALLGIKQGR
jgi:hypothetical protein